MAPRRCRVCQCWFKLKARHGCECTCHKTKAARLAARPLVTIRVYVYRHDYDKVGGGKAYYTLTYTRYQTSKACVHDVQAQDGTQAKKIAARQHKEACGNRVTPC